MLDFTKNICQWQCRLFRLCLRFMQIFSEVMLATYAISDIVLSELVLHNSASMRWLNPERHLIQMLIQLAEKFRRRTTRKWRKSLCICSLSSSFRFRVFARCKRCHDCILNVSINGPSQCDAWEMLVENRFERIDEPCTSNDFLSRTFLVAIFLAMILKKNVILFPFGRTLRQ